MKNKNILVALLSCSFVSFSHSSEMSIPEFDEASHVEAGSAAAVTPHEQKMADRIAKEHDTNKQKEAHPKKQGKHAKEHGKKNKNKKTKKAHASRKKQVAHTDKQ
jgi:hypothetical protein